MIYIIATLGCKVNQYETQAMESILLSHGHRPAAAGEIADAVIVNTCAVTAESGRKSRQAIRRLRDENPGAVLAVCGCYAQLEPDEAEEIGASVIFGAADRIKTVEAVEKAVADGEKTRHVDRPFERRELEKLPAGAVSGRTRAMLKIQDGCVNFCSYCIIPYTRGRLRSLPIESARAETVRLRDEGYRELVLTGIEVASYGVDLPGRPGLADVIEAVAAVSGEMRLRLGSLEPTVVTEDFCRRLAATGKVCRHFHLSLQSGCDRTLKAMNRKYDTAQAETLAFIRRVGFADIHVFPYSRRPGTPADSMPNQCTRALKAKRAHELQQAVDEMRATFLAQSVGQTLPVLFETEENSLWQGHSDTYLPVKAAGTGLRGQICPVRIEAVEGEALKGTIQ